MALARELPSSPVCIPRATFDLRSTCPAHEFDTPPGESARYSKMTDITCEERGTPEAIPKKRCTTLRKLEFGTANSKSGKCSNVGISSVSVHHELGHRENSMCRKIALNLTNSLKHLDGVLIFKWRQPLNMHRCILPLAVRATFLFFSTAGKKHAVFDTFSNKLF